MYRRVKDQSVQPTSHERIPASIERVIRQTNHYGRPFCRPLVHPLIVSIEYIPQHTHTLDRWGSWSCCWGNEVVVTAQYAEEGYQTVQGGRFDVKTGRWVWSCYAD